MSTKNAPLIVFAEGTSSTLGSTDEDEEEFTDNYDEKYVTYYDIVDCNGKVVASGPRPCMLLTLDAPADAAVNEQHIRFVKDMKDSNGNVVNRFFGEYKK